jgi:hypothetical protein
VAQIGLFEALPTKGDEVATKLAKLDLDQITPFDAMLFLAELKRDISD